MKSFERREQVLANRYAIENSLGSGGWGSVYAATDTVLTRKVALKIMHEHLTREEASMERFNREAEIVSHLVHPNICSVFDKGLTEDGQPYMVMEYLDGRPLDQVIAKEKRVSVKRTIQIIAQVCDALDFAHKRGVVHRDLKPSNIMILEGDVPKLLDFGLAKWHDSKTLTLSGNTVGTPDYMSPEQWNGLELDARTDIYSLGVTMFFMLTGESIVTATGLLPIADFHINQKPRHLSDVRSDLHFPPSLQKILDRCLEKDRENRFRDAFELKEALQNVAKGTSAEPAASSVLKKADAGSRTTKIATAVVGVAIIAGACVFAAQRANNVQPSDLSNANQVPRPIGPVMPSKPVTSKLTKSAPPKSAPLAAQTEAAKSHAPEPTKAEAAKPGIAKLPLVAKPKPQGANSHVATSSIKAESSKTVAPQAVLPSAEHAGEDELQADEGASIKLSAQSPAERQRAIRLERARLSGKILLANLESDEKAIEAFEKIGECNQLVIYQSNVGNPTVIAALKRWPNLSFLNMHITHVNDAMMPAVAQSKLTSLHVGVTGVSDAGMHALRGMKLVELGLETDDISDTGIAELAGMPLRNLILRATNVTSASAPIIANLQSLECLSLGRTRWSDAGVAELQKLPHLKQLDLGTTPITDAAIDYIVKMPELEELSISRTRVTERGIAKLVACPRLTRLDITGIAASPDTAKALAQMPTLTVIRWSAKAPEGMQDIFAAKQIRICDNRRTVFTPRTFARFR